MFDDPPAALILAEVQAALETGLPPGFAQKVAANALGIAQRELAATPPDDVDDEIAALIGATLKKLAVDQPRYPGLLALIEEMRGR